MDSEPVTQPVPSRPRGARVLEEPARLLAETIRRLVSRSMWGEAPEGLRSKLDKVDTADGWQSVRHLAPDGVPYLATRGATMGR